MIKFDTVAERERRPVPVRMNVDIRHLEDVPPKHSSDVMFQERFRLTAQVNVDFWSNRAQLPQKEREAKKMANSYIYKDMLPIVNEILVESHSEEVTELALRLKGMMLGDQY